jgi:FAD synthetase
MACQKKTRRVVLAAGVFDLLHFAHVKYLMEAKKAGGPNAELVVIVARDSTVEKRRGEKPVIPENQRLALVDSLKIVDRAILGYEDFSIEKAIEQVKPDVIALGYDRSDIVQTVKDYLKKKGLREEVVKIGKFGEDELNSSSKIKQRIIEHYKR